MTPGQMRHVFSPESSGPARTLPPVGEPRGPESAASTSACSSPQQETCGFTYTTDITFIWLLVRSLDRSEFCSDVLQSLLLDRTAAVSLADDNSTHGSNRDVNFSLLDWEERKCIIVGRLQHLLLSVQQERLSGPLPLII